MLDVALKEWAIVCDLLLEGKLALLLRKGGIHERGGPGVFRLEHERFALYPSWAHQKPNMIKPEHRERVVVREEPAEVTFTGWAEAAHIWRVPSRAAFDQLEGLHCWTAEQIDMRFGYKPENPLYLVALRAWRLPAPRTIKLHWRYSGCKSWVPLEADHVLDDAGSTRALPAGELDEVSAQVERTFAGAG